MSDPRPTPPPGWYASGLAHIARYWDGQAWTPHLARAGVATTVESVRRTLKATQIGWAVIAGALAALALLFGEWWSIWPLLAFLNIVGAVIVVVLSSRQLRLLRTGPSRFVPLA